MPLVTDPAVFAKEYVDNVSRVLSALPLPDLARAINLLDVALDERKQVFLAGNGGSAATASHMANDLMLGVAKAGSQGIRAIALSDGIPTITAIANDEGYDEIFASQLSVLGQPGDLLILISGSGNSPNVLRAAEVASNKGMETIGFLGKGGGKLASMVDIPVTVPSNDYGHVEDVHMAFDHLITSFFRGSNGK